MTENERVSILSISEWRILAGQVIAGQQPKLEEIICEHCEVDSIEELTIGQLVNWLEDNKDYIVPFIS